MEKTIVIEKVAAATIAIKASARTQWDFFVLYTPKIGSKGPHRKRDSVRPIEKIILPDGNQLKEPVNIRHKDVPVEKDGSFTCY
jgi:hypothetical protein